MIWELLKIIARLIFIIMVMFCCAFAWLIYDPDVFDAFSWEDTWTLIKSGF